jgi:PTS system cellobiose-specific IIA component
MPELTDDEIETYCMQIIANSGDAHEKAYEALRAAKAHDFPLAHSKFEEANKVLNQAHKFHSEVLKAGANGEIKQETVLLAHAQDHIMSTMTSLDFIKELIDLYEKIDGHKK